MESTSRQIITVRNKFFPSNTYILKNKQDGSSILIDPGLDRELIEHELAVNNLSPIAVISTHGHFDHVGSAEYFKKKFNAPFYLHEADLKISQSANFYLKVARIDLRIETPKPDVLLKGKSENLNIGGFQLSVRNFPGHSNGSCVIKWDDLLFSGDIIYKKGLGFNNFPGEDKLKLKHSILELFETFDGASLVLPGHGEAEYLQKIKNNNQDLIKFLI